MFYNKDKKVPYPSKSILKDVLSREAGVVDGRSSTGIQGCSHLLEQQLGKNWSSKYTLDQILRNAKDFDADKAKSTDDADERSYRARERVGAYFTRIEDIPVEDIHEYAKSVIIGFKLNNDGMRQYEKNFTAATAMIDEENGAIVYSTDLEEIEIEHSVEDILEAKAQLPYLLKMLQKGSEQMGASLLSFIIAMAKFFSANPKGRMTAGDYVAQGVYTVDGRGRLGRKFTISDNTNTSSTVRGFRVAVAWATGQNKEDQYYKIYQRLLQVCDVLGIDLANEDPTMYDQDVISRAVCVYMATNEEYVQSYGYCDPKILRMLQGQDLFRVSQDVMDIQTVPETVTDSTAIEVIANCVETIMFKETERWKTHRPKLVKQFLETYIMHSKGVSKDISLSNSTMEKGIVYDKTGKPMRFDANQFAELPLKEQQRQKPAVLCSAGYLIIVEDVIENGFLRAIDLNDAIYAMIHPGKKGKLGYVEF